MMTGDDIRAQSHVLGLLLIDDFALMSYASVIEPFRAANSLAGRPLYQWRHISLEGNPAAASNGASILADQKVGDPIECDTLFVFAAGDPSAFRDARTFAWLRRMAARKVRIAGVSGGPYLLARAGLLDGYRATIHWEHAAALREEFPALAIESGLYVIDRRRLTCAGGIAGLDMAIELIERDHGHALASRVGEWFIRPEARTAERPQRLSLRERFGTANDRVLRTLAAMEAAIEEPHPREHLADKAGISLRHLERLFVDQLGATVAEAYMRIRLDQAAQLLRATGVSVTVVALTCGFRGSSHFSRAFKARFGRPPSEMRGVGAGHDMPPVRWRQ